MACRAFLRRKTSYSFSGQSAVVLLFGSRASPFQHCNANNLLTPTLFTTSYHTSLPSLLVTIKPNSVFVRHFSTPTTPDAVTDSDDDDKDWVSIANGSATKSQHFVTRSLGAACTNILHVARFLVSAPFMSRLDWVHWREDMGLYVTWLLANCRFNITYLRAHVTITGRFLLKLCRGESLSIRESKLLSRTTAELLRIAPRATNIVLPFVEAVLPHFHTLFGILPSPLLRKMKQEEAARNKLKASIEYASFLEDTAREMALVAQNSESGGIQQTADEYARFASRCLMGKLVSNEKILPFSKLFNDEITLDYIGRSRLTNMCKCVGITPYGSDDFVRFMLRERLKSIKKGDELIQEKGVESLLKDELHRVCRERGIHSGEEMRQQLRDWLDLSLRHSIPSSLLILSREYIVSGKKCEEAILDAFCSLPYALMQIVGATFLPSKDPIMYKHRKLKSLDVQEKQIKEEERELSELKQSDTHTSLDVALKEMTIPTANGASGTRLCDLSNADAILVSALSLKMECEKFARLVNEEIYLCNSVQDKEGADGENDGEKEATNAQRGGREKNNQDSEKNNQDSEVYVNLKVSSLLRNRADAMFRKIDNVDAKIDERWRNLERYCDGKVDLEVVAVAASYLKDVFDNVGIQELMCNHSKYKGMAACRAFLRRKNSYSFSGQSAAVLLFGSRASPFQNSCFLGSGSSIRGFASTSGYSRRTVGLRPPVEGIPCRPEDFGTDYKHWFVKVEQPVGTREEIAAHYFKIMTDFVGNEDEARKKMYMVSTRCFYAFGALISEEEAEKLKQMPHVLKVIPDSYVDRETKDYGGEPVIDGQLVPYDPKYHKFFDDFWADSKARAEARDKEEAEARARGDIETDDEDDDDDDRISSEYRRRLKKIQGFSTGAMS